MIKAKVSLTLALIIQIFVTRFCISMLTLGPHIRLVLTGQLVLKQEMHRMKVKTSTACFVSSFVVVFCVVFK